MELDIVLHLGDVYWGNVGSADRLDFTVIGPAVNEASRIEALCAQHDVNLLVSETFAQAATLSRDAPGLDRPLHAARRARRAVALHPGPP